MKIQISNSSSTQSNSVDCVATQSGFFGKGGGQINRNRNYKLMLSNWKDWLDAFLSSLDVDVFGSA